MKDRRGFLKLLGIGVGAAVAIVATRIASTPVPAPRTIQDIEAPKPYIGPDGVPEGDYIKERPKVVPENIKLPEVIPDRNQWVVHSSEVDIDWEDAVNWPVLEPGMLIPTVDPGIVLTTTGTYNHSLGGYSNTADDVYSDVYSS